MWNTEAPATPDWYVIRDAEDTIDPARLARHWDGRRWSAPCWIEDIREAVPRYAPSDATETYGDRARRAPAMSQQGICWRPLQVA